MVRCDPCSCEYGCCALPIRLVVAVLLFLSIVIGYCQRTSFTVVLTEMVVSNKNTSNQACPMYTKIAKISEIKSGKKTWDENVQAWLLSSFFPGYVLSQITAGFICDKWGARYPILIGLGISTMVTFVTPYLVLNMDWKVVAMSRCILGLGQGVIYPAVTSCMQRWIPQSERSTIAGIVYAAGGVGTVVGNTMTGIIDEYWKDWKVVFTFWGTVSVFWLSFAFMYLFSFPEYHPFLPRTEEQLLKDEIVKRSERPLPFVKVLSSCKVWALVCGYVSTDIVLFTMATNFPKYMSNVLNYHTKELSFLSSIPFGLYWFGALVFGLISDWLVNKNANLTLVRKSVSLCSSFLPGVFLLAATYSNCNRTLAMTFFSLTMFFKGASSSSIRVNSMDLTRNYAGFLVAFANGIGSIAGFVSPKIIGWVAKDNSLEQWHNLMWGLNIVQLLFIIIFCYYGSADRERWDYEPAELKYLPPKQKTKWYLQLPPQTFEEIQFRRMEAARQRMA